MTPNELAMALIDKFQGELVTDYPGKGKKNSDIKKGDEDDFKKITDNNGNLVFGIPATKKHG